MGAPRAQLPPSTEERASGAQVIDNTLIFQGSETNQYLTRDPSTAGNQRTWTYSVWFKRTDFSNEVILFGADEDNTNVHNWGVLRIGSTNLMNFLNNISNSTGIELATSQVFRDDGWYHAVLAVDTTQATAANRVKLYVNGEQVTSFTTANYPTQNYDTQINSTNYHWIGREARGYYYRGYMSQVYLIDGQALDASYFGFTDSLTNTWRPKKFNIHDTPTADWGTNGFYLPFDGSAPIGQDQSGKGNHYTPVNIGTSTEILKATGALPTLNTINGGRVALPRVRGQVSIGVTVAPKTGGGNAYYLDGVEAPSLSKYRGQTITFDQSDSSNSGHPFRFATAADAAGSTEYTSSVVTAGTPGTTAYYGVDFDGSDFLKVEQSSSQFSGQGDYTVECWAKFDAFPADGALWSNWNASGSATRSILLEVNSSGGGFVFMINSAGGGGDWVYVNSAAKRPIPRIGQWYHLCQTYDHSATTTKCYIDGRFYGENTSVTVYNDSNADLHIGVNAGDANGKINGQVTNFRWSNNVRYASEFVPSRTPFTSDGNTVFLGCLDSSSATTAVTNNAGTISASGDPSVYTVRNVYGPYTKITVPYTAPNTLYYYCTNHSGMGGSVGVSTNVVEADPYASYCTLALPLAGDRKDCSNVVSVGIPEKNFTAHGNATSSTYTTNLYGGSYRFDGSGDYIETEGTTDLDQPGDFTLEYWVFFNDLGGNQIPVGRNSNWIGLQAVGDDLRIVRYGHATIASTQFTLYHGIWYHLALVRSGSTCTCYVNGTAEVTGTDSTATSPDAVLDIGRNGTDYNDDFDGFISDLRFYKGVAKYKSNFIVASTHPNISQDTPSGSTYNELLKPTAGSVSFDGTGDYLSGISTSEFVNDADWTLDGWFYLNSVPSSGGMKFIFDTGGGNNPELGVWLNNSSNPGMLQLYNSLQSGTGWDGPPIAVGRWYYFKETIDGSSSTDSAAAYKMYLDGVLCNATTINLSSRSASVFGVGARSDGSLLWDGFLSNIRYRDIVDNSLGIPSSPFTSDSDTKLLCCQGSSAINTAAAPPSPNNGTTWSTRSYWTGTSGDGTLTNASSYPLTAAFDGDLGTTFGMSYAGGMIWTPPSPISFSSTVEVYIDNAIGVGIQGYVATISGTQESQVDLTLSDAWGTIKSGSGTLDKLQIVRGTGSGNNNLWVTALRVDGIVLVDDVSALTPNGNAAASISNPFDTNINIVRGQETLYATWSGLNGSLGSSGGYLADGNLRASGATNGAGYFGQPITRAIEPNTGKYYLEIDVLKGYQGNISIGVFKTNEKDWTLTGSTNQAYKFNGGIALSFNDGHCRNNDSTVVSSYLPSLGDYEGGTFMMAIDTDNSKLWFGLNGKWGNNSGSGNPELGTNALLTNLNYAVYPYIMAVSDSATDPCHGILNCGQKPFHYPPPKGFETISVPNTPTNVVLPTKYFTPTLYSGTGSGPQNVDAGFKPDMVWIKSRNNAWYWNCYDSVRGSGKPGTDDAAYYIGCNDNSAQTNVNAVSGTQFQGFYGANQSGGYIPHYYTGGSGQELNTSGATYVGYCWKAGGGTGAGGEFWKDDKQYASAAAVGLSGGDYTPKACSINTKTGFAILAWDGALTSAGTKSIPHGLSGFADAGWMIISKRYDGGTSDWWVQHSAIADGSNVLKINSSNAVTNISGDGAITSPTNTLFYGNWNSGMAGSTNNVGYLWKDIPGVQKFGKYAGSGNNNGSVVELGFRPALVWVKSYDTAGQEWVVWDDKRAPYNEINTFLYLEQNIADNGDGADRKIDFLSNGFKFRYGASGATDYSGRNYIYCAWAEQPEYNLYGGQSNAR